MRYSLSKKGSTLDFIFSKLAFLIFGIIITSTFFYFIAVQKDIQSLDEISRTGSSISNVLAMASASPFDLEIEYKSNLDAVLNFSNSSFTITSGDKIVKNPLYFRINTTGQINLENCIKIEKIGAVEVSSCQ